MTRVRRPNDAKIPIHNKVAAKIPIHNKVVAKIPIHNKVTAKIPIHNKVAAKIQKTENKRKRKWQSVATQNAQTKMWAALRQVQRDCACTNKTLQYVMQAVFGMEKQKSTFVLDQQYSQKRLLLNGCVGCNQHVFLPGDNEYACPKCRHPRLNNNGKANEVIYISKQ